MERNTWAKNSKWGEKKLNGQNPQKTTKTHQPPKCQDCLGSWEEGVVEKGTSWVVYRTGGIMGSEL